MASNNQLEQYDGPRANLTINKVDPREEGWHVGTYWRDQFRFRVMLKNKGWFAVEKAKDSFMRFLSEHGEQGIDGDWFTTTVSGEDGYDGHSIYTRSISFMVMARMMDNIELEDHIHEVQERTDVEYEDDIPPLVLIPEDDEGRPIYDTSTVAPTLDSAFKAEQNQKTSRPLKVFTPVPVILMKSFGPELPPGTKVDLMLTVHGELYLLKDGCFCDDAKEGVDFTFLGSTNNTFGAA